MSRHRRPNRDSGRDSGRDTDAEVVRARSRGAAAKPQSGSFERPLAPGSQPQPQRGPQGAPQVYLPATQQPTSFTGSAFQGTNHSPVDYYRPQPPRGGGALSGTPSAPMAPLAFAPGDPIRPAAGIDDGYGGPRQWAYPTGVNITTLPRQTEGTAFAQLRNLAELYEGIQLCESVIFRIFDRLELQIVPHLDYLRADEQETDEKWLTPARAMRDWLMDPHRSADLHAWCKKVMRELLELDGCGIYYETTRGGGLYGLRVIEGDSLVRLVDASGAPPVAPYPAYLQVVNGTPAWMGTTDEVDYLLIHNRAGSLYGRPPAEQIIYRINMALRKEHWDLTHWTDGSTPEGLLTTDNPALLGVDADQMDQFERLFNGMLAGNDALRVRTKVVPPGWDWKPTKQSEVSTALDLYLLNLTAAAFGVPMDELGFTGSSNRSTGSTQEDVLYRNAVRPYTDLIARFLNRVIRRFHGTPIAPNAASISRPGAATTAAAGTWDARFVVRWGGIEEPYDWNQRVYAYSKLVQAGIVSPTQAKHMLHIPILPGEQQVPALMLAPAGPDSLVFIDDLVKQREQINAAHVAGLAAKATGAKQSTDAAAQQQQLQDLQIQQGQLQLKASQQQMSQQAETHDAQMEQHETQQTAAQQQIKQQAQQPAQPQGQQPPKQGPAQPGQPRQPSAQPAQGQGQGAQRGLGDRDRARGAAVPPSGEPGGAGSGRVRGGIGDGLGDAAIAYPQSHPWPAGTERGGEPTGSPSTGTGSTGSPGSGERASTGSGPSGSSGTGSGERASSSGGSGAGSGAGSASGTGSSGSSGSSSGSLSDEWRAFRERSLRAVKRGVTVPAFVPVLIPAGEHAWVAARLAEVSTPDAVRAIFETARTRPDPVAEPNPEPLPVLAAASVAPADDPLTALALALSERLAAMQQQELRALKAQVAQALSL